MTERLLSIECPPLRIFQVLESCKTTDQLETARKYFELWLACTPESPEIETWKNSIYDTYKELKKHLAVE